jgi:hypothetical protein
MPADNQLRRIVPPRPETAGNPETFWWGFLVNIFLCAVVTSSLSMHRFRSYPSADDPVNLAKIYIIHFI